jgi:hypothetical protein
VIVFGFLVAVVILDVLACRYGYDSRLERWLEELRRPWNPTA